MAVQIRHSLEAGFGAAINACTFFLILLNLEATEEAKNYWLSLTIFSAMNLMVMLLFEQFQVEYKKINYQLNKNNFYLTYIFIGAILSVILALFLKILLDNDYVVKYLMPGVSIENSKIIRKYLMYLVLCLPFYFIHNVTISKYIADRKITISYYLSYLPGLINLIGVAITFNFKLDNDWILISIALGFIIPGAFFMVKEFFNLKNYKFQNKVFYVLKKSIYVRGIHNIHNIFLSIIITNIVSNFSPMHSAVYMYLKKIIDTFIQILIGPINKIMMNKMHAILYRNNKNLLIKYIRYYKVNNFLILGMLTILLLILNLIVKNYVYEDEGYKFSNIYIILMILHGFIISIQSPYSFILTWKNKFNGFIIGNIIFISTFLVLKIFLYNLFELYFLGIVFMVSQLFNYYFIKFLSKHYMAKYE
jgi:hypothetical protein